MLVKFDDGSSRFFREEQIQKKLFMHDQNKLDEFDFALIKELSANCLISNKNLAEKINLSQAATLRRRMSLESAGVITAYTATINTRQLGLGDQCILNLRLKRNIGCAFANALDKFSSIVYCYEQLRLMGEWDLQFRYLAPDIEFAVDAINQALGESDNVESHQILPVLSQGLTQGQIWLMLEQRRLKTNRRQEACPAGMAPVA